MRVINVSFSTQFFNNSFSRYSALLSLTGNM